MSESEFLVEFWVARLRDHLQEERYNHCVASNYCRDARRFMRYLDRREQSLEAVWPADVDCYVNGLKRQRDSRTLAPSWRRAHRAAIQMLLRLVHDKWPPEVVPTDPDEVADRELLGQFDEWMREQRGLSVGTRESNLREMRLLLGCLRARCRNLATLTVADLDAHIASRCASMRRNSTAGVVSSLRGALRYMHGTGRTPCDLAGILDSPPIYALEGIPSVVRREDIDRALDVAQGDHSTLGRRDYAILMLLATYGMRAGEIAGLRLSDIDWRREKLRVRHSKTGACSELPLLRAPADALLDYVKYARPQTVHREVFIRAQAPYRPIHRGGAIYSTIDRRLRAVGVTLTGKRGPHVFRHSRAVSLLQGGVPIKVIGDVLGHRAERSTAVYLKLATADLRAVALHVPEVAR